MARSDGSLDGSLMHWVKRYGWRVALGIALAVVACGFILGAGTTWDLVVGGTRATEIAGSTLRHAAAFVAAGIGYLLIPAVIGAIAGAIIGDQYSSHRNLTPEEERVLVQVRTENARVEAARAEEREKSHAGRTSQH